MSGRDTADLALYLTPYCPYCMRVRRKLQDLGVQIEERDIAREPRHRKELVQARGRSTVPVLRVARPGGEEEWLPESGNIVHYLEERFG